MRLQRQDSVGDLDLALPPAIAGVSPGQPDLPPLLRPPHRAAPPPGPVRLARARSIQPGELARGAMEPPLDIPGAPPVHTSRAAAGVGAAGRVAVGVALDDSSGEGGAPPPTPALVLGQPLPSRAALTEMPLVQLIAALRRELGVGGETMKAVVDAACVQLGLGKVAAAAGEAAAADEAPPAALKDRAVACLAAAIGGA
eukprot:6904116-Prymnesium_polylepis.1